MTILDNGTRDQYVASASQTVFAYTFEVFVKEDLAVKQNGTLLSEGTDYTVSGVGNDSGGNVTLTAGATAGDIITIYRDMELARESDFQQSGDFLASEINANEDRQWAALQQVKEASDRGIRAAIDDTKLNSTNTELANVATRAGKVLGFDSTGGLEYVSANIATGDWTYFSTVAAMQAATDLQAGDVVVIGERANSLWDITTATADGYSILEATGSSLQAQLRIGSGEVDAVAYGATNGTSVDSKAALEAGFNFSRDNGYTFVVRGTFRIDSAMTWNAAGGANAQTVVRFENARITKNFNGAGLTCSGGSTMHVHYGDLIIDKMTNLGDGTGANATAGDYGFVQNSRLEREGLLLIENQAGDSYVCQADTNMNGSRLGCVRIRSCDGKGFTGTGTQDDCAIWTGDIWANDCYEEGIYIPDTFKARGWDMTMRGENCAQDGTADQIYTGGMSASRITGYGEKNTAGTGVDVHIPSASDGVMFYSWRIDEMTLSSSTCTIVQGNKIYTVGDTPTEGSVISENLSNDITKTVTKSWTGSASTTLCERVIRGNGELSYQVTGRTSGDVMDLDFLPDSGFTFRLQKNGTDEWKTLDGGVARFLGSVLAGGTSAIDSSAVIEARSTTKGLLLPRMTTTQRNAISSPSNGLMIYNTTTNKINIRAGGAWEEVTSA